MEINQAYCHRHHYFHPIENKNWGSACFDVKYFSADDGGFQQTLVTIDRFLQTPALGSLLILILIFFISGLKF
jgi:hypothetical protein